MGVRPGEMDVRRVRQYAEQALACRRELARSQRELRDLAAKHAVIQAQGAAVGVVTACVLWAHLGDPRHYDSGPAYRKAMGLNLAERSSGKWQGRLMISKRGPSEVRRWLYFAALRLVKQAGVKEWYEAKRAKHSEDRYGIMRALVGVMRRLALALYQVGACGERFEAKQLFPGSRSLKSVA